MSGNISFDLSCNKIGIMCTSFFKKPYITKSVLTKKPYTAKNGTKGEKEIFTISRNTNNGGSSSQSTTHLSIAAILVGSTWKIDYVNAGGSSSLNSGL
jgi:hypothetical protein